MPRSYSSVTPAELAELRRTAYDPTECDQCESIGAVCWECYDDAVQELVQA